MRKELDEKLCKTYPDIFRERDLSPQETCMCWGFPGDGWYKIIDELCKQLTSIQKVTGLQVVAKQVKEKFGTLRFYVSVIKISGVEGKRFHVDIAGIGSFAMKLDNKKEEEDKGKDDFFNIWESIIYACIHKAEALSAHTCEECGDPGKLVLQK